MSGRRRKPEEYPFEADLPGEEPAYKLRMTPEQTQYLMERTLQQWAPHGEAKVGILDEQGFQETDNFTLPNLTILFRQDKTMFCISMSEMTVGKPADTVRPQTFWDALADLLVESALSAFQQQLN